MRNKIIFLLAIALFGLSACSLDIKTLFKQSTPEPAPVAENQPAPSPPSNVDVSIKVTQPEANTLVVSPLVIKGEAKGSWFFEASFPIKLLDDKGTVLAQGTAQAQGNWMTEDFVPFTAQLNFSKPSATAGSLILSKDNPSGLPANDRQIVIPVNF
jgi:hypothetical protein